MKFIGAKFTRPPQLIIFEYVREGALGDHDNISANEGVQILGPCLSALGYISTDMIRPSYIEISSRITFLSSIDTPATFMSSLGTLGS